MPPSLREWLPEGHLAWFVIDAVAALDLGAFYAAYRDDGQGRAAHDPAMMVALLLYSYAIGERSSRRIERRCVRGRRHAGDLRQPGARITRRSRASASATRRALARAVRRGARALRRGRAGARRGDRGRRHEGARQRVRARDARLRADRARDPRARRPRSTPRRTSGSAMRRGDELPPELATRAGPPAAGCATPSAASMSAAPQEAQADPARRGRSG